VSHDMKKTVVGMNGSLTDLRQSLTDPGLLPKVDLLLQRNAELKKDLADLGKYGRRNFVAEQSEVLDLCGIVRKVADELRPDCEANGIVLEVTVPDALDIYAKRAALESVILNLILNAIEHSSCTQLDVIVTKRKGDCLLRIIDNGTGVTTDRDIFEPFVSTASSENNTGLGLFLARAAVGSMHGELTYERRDGLTVGRCPAGLIIQQKKRPPRSLFLRYLTVFPICLPGMPTESIPATNALPGRPANGGRPRHSARRAPLWCGRRWDETNGWIRNN